jgi:MFS family permease
LYAPRTDKRQYPRLPRQALQSTTFTPFARLAFAHAAGVAGDVFVTIALADSIFFSSATSTARFKILLYLVITMAPFAVIAPVLGPLLDRSRGGRRLILMLAAVLRGVVCLVMANHLHDLYLYPLAFTMLVLSKTQQVTKNALVPGVVDHESELVKANSRLQLMSILAGTISAPIAGLFLKVLDGGWVLRAGAFVFFGAGLLALGVPRAKRVGPDETVAQRAALHVPSIVTAGTAMGLLRGVVGFMTFWGAIVIKSHDYGAKEFGLLIAASAIGNGCGALLAPVLRRRVREEWILVGAITAPSVVLLVAARSFSIGWLALAAATIASGAACGRLAFDSLVQRDAADAARGRAFARFETRFQLVWVCGGVLATIVPTNGRLGLFLVALVLLFVGFTYLGRVRHLAPGDASVVTS